jgi:hypothetical protein
LGDARAVAAMYLEGGQLYPPNENVSTCAAIVSSGSVWMFSSFVGIA